MSHPLLAFFGNIPLFSSLNAQELGEIVRAIKPIELQEGDFLFKEGDNASRRLWFKAAPCWSTWIDRMAGSN